MSKPVPRDQDESRANIEVHHIHTCSAGFGHKPKEFFKLDHRLGLSLKNRQLEKL